MFIYALKDNSSTNTVHRSSSVNCISDKDHLHSVNEGGRHPSRPLSAVKLDVQSACESFSGDYLVTLSDAVNLIKTCQDRSICSAAVPNMSYLTASHWDSEGRKSYSRLIEMSAVFGKTFGCLHNFCLTVLLFLFFKFWDSRNNLAWIWKFLFIESGEWISPQI